MFDVLEMRQQRFRSTAVQRHARRPADAVQDAREALRLRSEALELGWRSLEVENAQLHLGEALLALQDVDAARQAYAEAATHFAAALGDDHPRTRAVREAATR